MGNGCFFTFGTEKHFFTDQGHFVFPAGGGAEKAAGGSVTDFTVEFSGDRGLEKIRENSSASMTFAFCLFHAAVGTVIFTIHDKIPAAGDGSGT